MKKQLRISLGLVLGALAGFSYFYFIGCKSGSCPLTGNPYISTLYGAFVGLIVSFPSTPKKTDSPKQNS